jgi:hypothetical protein
VIDPEQYLAYHDEVWRFNVACKHGAKPTVYCEGRTYQIYWTEMEADILWFLCFELVWDQIQVHSYLPSIVDTTLYCMSSDEWDHILLQTGVTRHPFFNGQRIVSGKLVTSPLTLP